MLTTTRAVVVLALVSLASRSAAATFTVLHTNDSGAGSLRQALQDAKNLEGADTIAFAIPGNGPHTIALLTPLGIDSAVFIDGYSQPGSAVNTLESGSNAVLRIEIDGSSMMPESSGLSVISSGVTLRGLAVRDAPENGIRVVSVDDVHIEGCFVGIAADGTTAAGNALSGIHTGSATDLVIGGPAPGQRNVISSNGLNGVTDVGPPTAILNNLVGTDRTGQLDRGNAQDGIFVIGGGSVVGSDDAESANVVRFNGRAGIGVAAPATAVAVLANHVGPNDGLGIDLEPGPGSPVTANDADDADTGANDRQNFPVLTAAVSAVGMLSVEGTLDVPAAASDADYTIRFFRSDDCDASGNGEGEEFLGAVEVSLSGDAEAFAVEVPGGVADGTAVTATATEVATGNTSEFSACLVTAGDAPLCGDSDDNGSVTAGDALTALRTAVGSTSCELCRCDVNSSGGVASGDALLILKHAVGQVVAFNCPPCS
ncbi:MAG: hypothetical protein ABR538_11455 [Candidatus Binatia bacterium]